MEHRLLHRSGEVSSGDSGEALPRPDMAERAQAERLSAMNTASGLREQLAAEAVIAIATPEGQKKNFEELTIGLLSKVAADAKANSAIIDGEKGMRSRLLSGMSSNRDGEKFLEEVLTGLTTAPEVDVSSPQKHPFLRSRQVTVPAAAGVEKKVWHYSQVKLLELSTYRDRLKELSSSMPQFAEDFAQLDRMLLQWQQIDAQRLAIFEQKQLQRKNPTDAKIMSILGLGGFVVAAAGATVAGLMSFMGKKPPTAALIYAGIAGIIASPTLRGMIFEGKYEGAMKEINSILNNAYFLSICKSYGVQGKTWESVAETVTNQAHKPTNDLLKQIADTGGDPEKMKTMKIEEKATQYASEMIPESEPDARAALVKMIMQQHFASFAASLRSGGRKDTKLVVNDYIREGSWKYRTDLPDIETLDRTLRESQNVVEGKITG